MKYSELEQLVVRESTDLQELVSRLEAAKANLEGALPEPEADAADELAHVGALLGAVSRELAEITLRVRASASVFLTLARVELVVESHRAPSPSEQRAAHRALARPGKARARAR